jgi:hypothetical protein
LRENWFPDLLPRVVRFAASIEEVVVIEKIIIRPPVTVISSATTNLPSTFFAVINRILEEKTFQAAVKTRGIFLLLFVKFIRDINDIHFMN